MLDEHGVFGRDTTTDAFRKRGAWTSRVAAACYGDNGGTILKFGKGVAAYRTEPTPSSVFGLERALHQPRDRLVDTEPSLDDLVHRFRDRHFDILFTCQANERGSRIDAFGYG